MVSENTVHGSSLTIAEEEAPFATEVRCYADKLTSKRYSQFSREKLALGGKQSFAPLRMDIVPAAEYSFCAIQNHNVALVQNACDSFYIDTDMRFEL